MNPEGIKSRMYYESVRYAINQISLGIPLKNYSSIPILAPFSRCSWVQKTKKDICFAHQVSLSFPAKTWSGDFLLKTKAWDPCGDDWLWYWLKWRWRTLDDFGSWAHGDFSAPGESEGLRVSRFYQRCCPPPTAASAASDSDSASALTASSGF